MDEGSPLVLLDHSRPEAWKALAQAAQAQNAMGFAAQLRLVADPAAAGSDEAALRRAHLQAAVIFAADERALTEPGSPILCIDPEGRSPSFRARAADLWIVENNVASGNMLFEELVEQVGDDGVLAAGLDV